ncbi:MAG: MBL fold metallo-hydrolase, partial [Bacillota bacterium]|nr:MBL fold metallo-hydrolase [Bacillota bacterium]
MKVTYLHHSGFLVETETKVLLFDYYTEGGRKTFFDPAAYPRKDIFVFVSHAHEDHYDRRILDWEKYSNVKYVLSFDVRTMLGFTGEVLHVQPHETYTFDGIVIQTLQSNDEGVAFLVKADGKTIYHAGDLNWWHWNGEPDEFNDDIRRSYTTEIDLLKEAEIDVAFVPADLRLED